MTEEEKILTRFNLFYTLLEIPKNELGNMLSMDKRNINRVFNNSNSLLVKIKDIHFLGCNINWLISGEGPVVVKNLAGTQIILKSKYLNEDGYLKSQVLLKRIISWIEFNYDNLQNFSIKFNCSDVCKLELNEYDYALYISENIYEALKVSGCNLKWLFSNNNDISPYETNTNGQHLRSKNKGKQLSYFEYVNLN